MRKRLFEQAKVVQAVPPIVTTTAETLFNNVASGGTNGIDTKDFDDAMVEVNLGTMTGDLDVSVVESDTNDSSTATAVADINGVLADLNQFTTAGAEDDDVYLIGLKAKDLKRYIWVKTVNGDVSSKTYGINVLLSDADENVVTQANTVQFTHSEGTPA